MASVTLDYGPDVVRDSETDASDLATAIALALIRVGQSNLAAQIASACSARSRAVLKPDVAMPLAETFYRARRVPDALLLAREIAQREEPEARMASMMIQTAAMARGRQLTAAEGEAAVEVARERLERSRAGDDAVAIAADAYNLGQALRNARLRDEAIAPYREAARLDPSYEDRGYFNSELAGMLFESQAFEESAERYQRAYEMEQDPFLVALKGDALLWSGRYDEAREAFEAYVQAGTRDRDAEWRLKRRVIEAIIDVGGREQQRDPSVARNLVAPVDLESNFEMTLDEAREACVGALRADACCAEAWFRLAFLVLAQSNGADTARAFELSLTSAVLHREAPGAWNNAVVMAGHAGLTDDVVRDALRMAYRFCGADIATALSETAKAFRGAPNPDVMQLLDEVMREVDDDMRPARFTMRFPAGDGTMTEFAFITEVAGDDPSEAHTLFRPPTGTPVERKAFQRTRSSCSTTPLTYIHAAAL